MKRPALDSISKISQHNLDRIAQLKLSGYEPNDYIISQGLDLLEKNPEVIIEGKVEKRKLVKVTKISNATRLRIEKLKISGYEPNDFIVAKALDLLVEKRNEP